MKHELLLLRHAKSDWHSEARNDHQRPLNPRGLRAAPRMGAFMRDEDLMPDRILCSTAVRTRQTLDGLLGQWPADREMAIEYSDAVYEAGLASLLKAIQPRLEPTKRLLVVGHNPGMELLLWHLVGPEALRDVHKYPTCALSQIALPDARLEAGSGVLVRLQFVRELPKMAV